MEFNTDISYTPHTFLFVQHHKILAHLETTSNLLYVTGHSDTVPRQGTPARWKLVVVPTLAFSLRVFLANITRKSFYGTSSTAWTPISLCLILLKYTRLPRIYFQCFPPDGLAEHSRSCCPTARPPHFKIPGSCSRIPDEKNTNLPLRSPLGHPEAQQARFCGKSSFSSHILAL